MGQCSRVADVVSACQPVCVDAPRAYPKRIYASCNPAFPD